MTNEEFLLDMLEYYTGGPYRRSTNALSTCTYFPPRETSQGCAIGRHLIGTDEQKKEWDTQGDSGYRGIVADIEKGYIDDIRPEWMKTMNIAFLRNVQNLHDGTRSIPYWEENDEGSKLTSAGKDQLNYIISHYELDVSKFSKFL